MKRVAVSASGVILIGLSLGLGLVLGLVWFISSRGFSARQPPSGIETFVARHLRRLASEPDARDLKNPLTPAPLPIAEGRDHYADHCAICHANNGSGETTINAGLYPPAPDLRAKATQDLTDGELFYIVQNGVRFTGMPGWGGEPEENWKLVLFIRHLPEITPIEIDFMKELNHLEE